MKKILALVAAFAVVTVVGCDSAKTSPSSGKVTGSTTVK